MGKILENMTSKLVANPEPLVLGKPDILEEPGLEVVFELVPLQEEISSQPTKIEELSIETLVDLSVELTIELMPSLTPIRDSLSLTLLAFMTHCRSFCKRQDHRRSDYSLCEVQLVQFSS